MRAGADRTVIFGGPRKIREPRKGHESRRTGGMNSSARWPFGRVSVFTDTLPASNCQSTAISRAWGSSPPPPNPLLRKEGGLGERVGSDALSYPLLRLAFIRERLVSLRPVLR